MSETPQERIEKWLAEGHWVKEVDEPERGIRKAIQAVLARLAAFEAGQKPLEGDSRSRVLRRLGVADADEGLEKIDRLYMAEAERDALATNVRMAGRSAEHAKAERDALRDSYDAAAAAWGRDEQEYLQEVERLRGLLTEWIPRHSAACCTPTPEIGTFPPGPFLPKWCCCDDLSKRSRSALEEKP